MWQIKELIDWVCSHSKNNQRKNLRTQVSPVLIPVLFSYLHRREGRRGVVAGSSCFFKTKTKKVFEIKSTVRLLSNLISLITTVTNHHWCARRWALPCILLYEEGTGDYHRQGCYRKIRRSTSPNPVSKDTLLRAGSDKVE